MHERVEVSVICPDHNTIHRYRRHRSEWNGLENAKVGHDLLLQSQFVGDPFWINRTHALKKCGRLNLGTTIPSAEMDDEEQCDMVANVLHHRNLRLKVISAIGE